MSFTTISGLQAAHGKKGRGKSARIRQYSGSNNDLALRSSLIGFRNNSWGSYELIDCVDDLIAHLKESKSNVENRIWPRRVRPSCFVSLFLDLDALRDRANMNNCIVVLIDREANFTAELWSLLPDSSRAAFCKPVLLAP